MKTQHLSDEDIQMYVLSISLEMSVIDHLQVCDACKTRLELYQKLFTAIKEQSPAEFDFNLSELVMTKIRQEDPAYFQVFWLFAIIGIFAMVITLFSFEKHLANMFSRVSEMASYLVLTTAIAFLLFQGTEIVMKYKRQMDKINLGNEFATLNGNADLI